MTKQQLRKQFMAKRQQLSVMEYDALNQALLCQFQQLDLAAVRCLHLFLPIRERKEPDTFPIREWLRTNYPQIKIVFPRADFDTLSMPSYADDDALELVTNAFDIPEPVSGTVVATAEVDMVLLPLLAFDKNGYRVGYGKGFYDRFLADCKPGTRFVGLSFFEPVTAIDDVNEFDVQMDSCIMPGMIWRR